MSTDLDPASAADLSARLEHIRRRLALLERCDSLLEAFGAHRHGYQLEPPLDEATVAAFEAHHGIRLPLDYRAFITTLGAAGAGPFYGLKPLAAPSPDDTPWFFADARDPAPSLSRPFSLSEAWRPAGEGDVPPVPAGTSLYDGLVQLSDHGCGYFDVIVVNGPQAGRVWADFSQALGGIEPWYDSFLDAYEAWLERAFVEWACEALPNLVRGLPDPEADAALAIAAPLLEKRVAEGDSPSDPAYIAYPVARERLVEALAHLRIVQMRHDEALAIFDQLAEISPREPQARRHLGRARVFGSQGDLERCLEEADLGLASADLWRATRIALMREKHAAFGGLARRDDALDMLRQIAATDRNDLFSQYDLAWVLVERDRLDEAAEVLVDAARRAVGSDPAMPLEERLVDVPSGLLEALEREGLQAQADALRERIAAAATATDA